MIQIDATMLGVFTLMLGLGLLALTLFLYRAVTRRPSQTAPLPPPPIRLELVGHREGVLLVHSGGRVAYLNEQAQEWFGVSDDLPGLEWLARLVRPSDSFLALCAAEGQARLSVNGRFVDAVSYSLPTGESASILVSMRSQLEADDGLDNKKSLSATQILGDFSDLNQAMSASLDFETTLLSILRSVAHLIPSDLYEITVWDSSDETFSPYHLNKTADIEHRIESRTKRYLKDKGFSGYLFTHRAALLIADVNTFEEVKPAVNRNRNPFLSYLGVPLITAGEFVGTLELASLQASHFTNNDREILISLARLAAVALRNSVHFQREQQRTQELAGLTNLSQVVSSVNDPQDLYARLVESLAPLMKVEILGFLIYDENRRMLVGQAPFLGIPTAAVQWYQALLPSGSTAETIWQSQEVIVVDQADGDERLLTLGLDVLARTAGLHQTVLAPLVSGGRMMGYLQVANKLDQSTFNSEDLRLLAKITNQVTPIIENAQLNQEARRRAQRSETLRRIASLISSNATLDEVLKYSLIDLARLVQADLGGLFLLDETRGELRLHPVARLNLPVEILGRLERISTLHPHFGSTVTATRRDFFSNDLTGGDQIPAFYRALPEMLAIQSAFCVPLIVRERAIGELMLGSLSSHFFNKNDILSAETVAGQIAAAIDRSSLASQTDQGLHQQVEQLSMIARVSRELNSRLDLPQILQSIHAELLDATGADCGSILIFRTDISKNGTPAPVARNPELLLQAGDPVSRLNALEKQVIHSMEKVVVVDYQADNLANGQIHARASKTAPTHLGIRSALIVPIFYQGLTGGLIHLHSRSPGYFSPARVEIVETLAIQAAIAIANARRYQEQLLQNEQLRQRLGAFGELFEISHALQSQQPLPEAVEKMALAIQSVTGFRTVQIACYDHNLNRLQWIAQVGKPGERLSESESPVQSWEEIKGLLQPERRIGSCYYLPAGSQQAIGLAPVSEADPSQTGNFLLAPLVTDEGQPLALVSAGPILESARPEREIIEDFETLCNKLGLTLQNWQESNSLQDQIEGLENTLQSIKLASQAAQEMLPFLQEENRQKEQEIAVLDERAQRISAGLSIAETINQQENRESVLQALGQALLSELGFSAVLIAEPAETSKSASPRLLYSLGAIPTGINPGALLGQRNPLRQCIQSGESLLVSDLGESNEWRSSPLLTSLEARSFVCLPILRQDGVDAALLAVATFAQAFDNQEDWQLIDLLGRQTAVAIYNQKLLENTRRRLNEVILLQDFSRKLGSLDTASILNALVESALQALPAAQSAMVALWDTKAGVLVPQTASGYANLARLLEISLRPGEGLPGLVFEEARAVIIDEVEFARQYNLSPDNLLRYRDATGGRLPVSSMVIPITSPTQANPLGVLGLDNTTTAGAFTSEDLALVASLVQQTALSLENARLFQASLERAHQLQALTQFAASVTSSLEPHELVATLLNQLGEILPYETGTLWLQEEEATQPSETMVVRSARGFPDSDERVGIKVEISDSLLLAEMIRTGLPISVENVEKDDRFPSLMEFERLSWLGLPLIASGRVVGVIALEKTEPGFYTSEHIQVATTFAGQAAVALENARLYQQSLRRARDLAERSQRLAMLNRFSAEMSSSLDLTSILNYALEQLYQVIDCTSVSALLFDASGQAVLQAEHPASMNLLPVTLPDAPLYERLRQTCGVFFSEDPLNEPELAPLKTFLDERSTRTLLVLPLATAQDLHGLLLAHAGLSQHFYASELELARTISNQVSIAMQNARLFAETRSLSEDLEQRVVARTAELAREHQRTETLLRIITELSASLDLEQVLNRTLRVLNEMIDAEQITILITRPGEKKLFRLASIGNAESTPSGGTETPIGQNQGLAGWVISRRQPALIEDVLTDERWVQLSDTTLPEYRSALAVPLMVGAEALGVLLLFHRLTGHFSTDQLELVQAAANQIAVAVNNAELYRLIRDQAEDLGGMLRRQQVETSRSKAILEAVADGVLVTDSNKVISLFNAAAERILSLNRSQVLGKPLEQFTGLFGRAAQPWREIIQNWSQDPGSFHEADTYEEQITLENGNVVSIRLAPVRLRNDFLGTVSIFQDITHQVEVDRLKSEFVATVSHELRTPMTSIRGYVEILLMGAAGELDDQQKRFLEVVKTNAERLSVLVNDLLDISRIESGKATLTLQALNLEELAIAAVNELERRCVEDHKGIIIQKDLPPDLPRVNGDPERVRQILDNLLDNAYQYNLPGGTITIRMSKVDNQIQVDIEDTGMGIPKKEQERVFERFFRGENPLVLGVSGTGLGLSIVQNLIEMHGGRIWLSSRGEPGEGSTFSFTLPIYAARDRTTIGS